MTQAPGFNGGRHYGGDATLETMVRLRIGTLKRYGIEAQLQDRFPDPAARAAFQQVQPNWNFTHISRDVLPELRERGVTDEQITTMLVDTPRRYFENAAG